MSKLHRSEFLKEVKSNFPETTENINKEEGLLSFELDVFIKFVQRQIDLNETSKTEIAFTLLEKYYQNGNRALHELIRNAVCEDFVFTYTKYNKRLWAYALLPESLKTERKAWVKSMCYRGI